MQRLRGRGEAGGFQSEAEASVLGAQGERRPERRSETGGAGSGQLWQLLCGFYPTGPGE